MKADLEFAADPEKMASHIDDQPAIPHDAIGNTPVAYRKRIAWLLAHGWDDHITYAETALRNHTGAPLRHLRELLDNPMNNWGSWETFNVEDSLVFPITSGVNPGEGNPIELLAIPSENLAATPDSIPPAILSGRLHAAAHLITAVLPAPDYQTLQIREALIREISACIRHEEQAEEAALRAL